MRETLVRWGLVLIFAAYVIGGTQPGVREDPASPVRPDPDLVEPLDRVIQKRFQDLTEEDIREGRFGIRRIIGLSALHPQIFPPETSEELLAVRRLREAGWSSAFYVVGSRGVAGNTSKEKVAGPIFAADNRWPITADPISIGAIGRRAMAENVACRGAAAECFLESRPVRVSSSECSSCHRGKALGEPLGAVVYAFHRRAGP